MSREQTKEVLEQYRATLEQQLGRLWAAREHYRAQIVAIDVEMAKKRQALEDLGTIKVEPEPVAKPAIRELKTEEGKH